MKNNFTVEIKQVATVLRSDEMQRTVRSVLPPSIPLDKFNEVTLAGIENNPDVLDADRESLYRACIQAARRGLLPDKREGALVVYNTNVGTRDQPRWMAMVQFMPMVEGIIKEMAKAEIDAYAVSVHANDKIRLWNDDAGQHVEHEPLVFGDRGSMVGVFAAAKTKTGRSYVEAMNLADIKQVAARSKQNTKAKDSGQLTYGGTWKSDFDRMAQKSALHRLRKRLPILDEDALQNLKDMDEQADTEFGLDGQLGAESQTPQLSNGTGASDPITPQDVTPSKSRTPRRSRVLEEVVQQQKAAIDTEKAQVSQQIPMGTMGKTADQEWSDIRDDDIV